MKVARTMEATASGLQRRQRRHPGAMTHTRSSRHWEIEDIDRQSTTRTSRSPRTTRGVQMHVAYDDSVPYIANVSLAVHFDKTVTVK